MIKVLLVDDMIIIRKSIRLLIDGSSDIQIIGECDDGEEVIGFVMQNETDIVLMDVSMPNCDGIEASKLVSSQFPKIKIIAHSSHTDEESINKMKEAGAVDYIIKNQNKRELINAIHRAYYNN